VVLRLLLPVALCQRPAVARYPIPVHRQNADRPEAATP
jgi:hypothetical protein